MSWAVSGWRLVLRLGGGSRVLGGAIAGGTEIGEAGGSSVVGSDVDV